MQPVVPQQQLYRRGGSAIGHNTDRLPVGAPFYWNGYGVRRESRFDGGSRRLCDVIQSQQQQKKNALECQLAAAGVIPLPAGMDSTAVSARADAERRYTQGQRNVGVGRGNARFGAYPQVPVHRMQGLKQQGIVAEPSCRAIANPLDRRAHV